MNTHPEWLNNEFLEKALNSRTDGCYKVLSSEIKKATAPGDNYLSDIYRATMKIENKGIEETMSVIVKVELKANALSKMAEEMDAFRTEANAYTLVLPYLEKLLKDAAPESYRPYAAKCFYTHLGQPCSVLVLEDLKQSGFRLVDKCTELDMDHCLLVVKRLATFQAASVVLFATDPNKIEPFRKDMINENMRETMDKMYVQIMKKVAKEAENWPECRGPIVKKLNEIADDAFNLAFNSLKKDDSAFNVLAHGDVWINNMMFRYEEDIKKVVDIRLVDLQVYNWTSPTVDLLYFINANCSFDVLEKQHIVVDEYYKTLCETLSVLGHQHLCPSREHLNDQIKKRCKIAVLNGLLVRSNILSVKGEGLDIENILSNEGDIPFSEAYKVSVRKILPLFYRNGWL